MCFPDRIYNFRNPERLRMHRVFLFHERGVKGSSRCSVAAMATFCLLAACKDAPLGQRQGGVFRFPPPYLWTPPTPQRVKGCTPLTILKKWATPEKTEDSRLFGVKIF